MGVGMMNMASNGMMGAVANNAMNNTNVQASTQSYDPYAQNNQPQIQPINTQTEVLTEQPIQQPTQQVPSAKFCSNCGTPATGKFCSNCGHQI